MAGLLAAHYFRHERPTVLEQAADLPDNHGALLRFRSRAVMDITGAPLREVRVRKAILEPDGLLTDKCSIRHSNSYSKKVTGLVTNRSIENLEPVTRWVAEPDFLKKLARGVDICFNSKFMPHDAFQPANHTHISTVPMKMWVDYLLGDPEFSAEVEFKSTPITTIETTLYDVDVHQTMYIPWMGEHLGEFHKPYRVSIVGNRYLAEYTGDDFLSGDSIEAMIQSHCFCLMGFQPKHGEVRQKTQRLGKIVPLPDDLRRHLIGKITETFNVYSVGRFATWRQILLDDVVNDLKVVERLIKSGQYGRKLHYAGG